MTLKLKVDEYFFSAVSDKYSILGVPSNFALFCIQTGACFQNGSLVVHNKMMIFFFLQILGRIQLGEMSLTLETVHYMDATELPSSLKQQLIPSKRIFTNGKANSQPVSDIIDSYYVHEHSVFGLKWTMFRIPIFHPSSSLVLKGDR